MLHLVRPSLLPRELIRLAHSSLRLAPFSTSAASSSNAPPGPFSFAVGEAFHTKPSDPSPRKSPDGKPIKQLQQGFAAESPLARWRDESLKAMPWGAGHDWLFSEDTQGGGVVVGIADGVGGWEESGVNPAFFAQGLMWHASEEVRRNRGNALKGPREILRAAYDGVVKDPGVIAGSSTACIVSLDGNKGTMKAANLGDSTFFVLRNQAVIYNQPAQAHFFNCPYQLAKMPAGRRQQGSIVDEPEDAALFEMQLESGDIVILGTDGFSDNVHKSELEQITKLVLEHQVRDALSDEATMDRLALACVNYARLCSFKEDKESPFEIEARQQGIDFPGGKVDDVTVMAVHVSRDA